jgi:hypothetical protein
VDEYRHTGFEAARVEIERREAWIPVDVEPFTAGVTCSVGSESDDASRDTAPMERPTGLRVEQERVIAAVPGDVHEPDERSLGRTGGHPSETVGPNSLPPPGLYTTTVRPDELDHLLVRERAAPDDGDLWRCGRRTAHNRRVTRA